MPNASVFRLYLVVLLTLVGIHALIAQDILPPAPPWSGKSEGLIVKKDHAWITPAESSGFTTTPTYSETVQWLEKLSAENPRFRLVSIGTSAEGRKIVMLIATAEQAFTAAQIAASSRPALLVQAGIHAGEIDGKDAGLMLLRDIAFGSKKSLLDKVNLLFIPILNVDGHERSSPYNRVNQRGPANMGWRTNARNLNLNRDYAKLDSEEIRAVTSVMNEYDPEMYVDLHVTDGVDFQYDITYGYNTSYSPAIRKWFDEKMAPFTNKMMQSMGHIPGPLFFAANGRDFRDGLVDYPYSTRFSNNYGDIRHLPAILVENHSLKPFRQRVLGTYVFLESLLRIVGNEGESLMNAIRVDAAMRNEDVVLSWKESTTRDSLKLLGIKSERKQSSVTSADYVVWTAKPENRTVSFVRYNTADKTARKPRAYIVPSTHPEVIARLKMHGIRIEEITKALTMESACFRLSAPNFASRPFEGHFTVTAAAEVQQRKLTFAPGSVRVPTDQRLGDLVVHLLHPESPDSFLQWGFFHEIFNRTEYIEEYVMEPLAMQLLNANPALRREFEDKKKAQPDFAENPQAIYEWFYARSPYVDDRYLLYPVGIED